MAAGRTQLRCTLVALLAAWVSMLFGTSAPIAYLGLSQGAGTQASGLADLPITTWEVGDAVGPIAKLLLIGVFAALVLPGEQVGIARPELAYVWNAALGIAAVLLTLGLVPESLSRGFGVGLTGRRYDPAVLPIYVFGGVLGGVAYTFSVARCRSRISSSGQSRPRV